MLRAMGTSPGRLLLAVLAVLAGCVSNTTPTPLEGPIPVKQLERFRILGGDQLLGYLVLSEIGELRYYRVVTPTGIWVGDVDRDGRFFKSEPFREQPRELGVYTMNQGLGLLLETDVRIRILPMEGRGEPTEAAAHKLLRHALATKPSK
jgi:hypothetical protein